MNSARLLFPLFLSLTLAACGGSAAAPAASPSAASPAAAAAASKPAAGSSAAAKPASAAASASAAPAGSAAAKPAGATRNVVGDPNGTPISIAYASPAVASWPYYAADAGGFFAQQHLKVTMIQMAANVSITALSKGEIDFQNSPSNSVEGATRGLPLKMVLSSWDRTPWTVVGKKEFNSLKDLKGKQVGTNLAGSSPYQFLEAALKRDGMKLTDLQVSSAPGTQDTYALLIAGRLDAAVVSPPFDALAAEKGFHEVEFIGDALQLPYIGLGTNTTVLQQKRPLVVATIKALMDGNAWLKSHPDEAAGLIVKNIATSPEIAKASAEKMMPLLSSTGELPVAGVQQMLDLQAEVTKQPVTLKPGDVVDWGPLHEALGKS